MVKGVEVFDPKLAGKCGASDRVYNLLSALGDVGGGFDEETFVIGCVYGELVIGTFVLTQGGAVIKGRKWWLIR